MLLEGVRLPTSRRSSAFRPQRAFLREPGSSSAGTDGGSHRRTLWHDRALAQEAGVVYAAPPTEPADGSVFSDAEQAQIREAIAAAKVLLRLETPDLSENDFHALESRLDDLTASLTTLGRRQWIDHARGAIVSLVLDQLVPHGIVLHVFGIIAREVPHLLPLGLPALLP
jgi:hypothetical protein